MKMQQRKLIMGLLAAFLLMATLPVIAQKHTWRATLPAVASAGYYKVMITPAVSARTAIDGRDLRIRDAEGVEIPYLLRSDSISPRSAFHPFRIQRAGKGEDGRTHIILRNDAGRPLYAITVVLRNTAASRMAAISGSSDDKTYFSLIDSVLLSADGIAGSGDSVTCFLRLPQTTYPFLQLTIFDKDLLPLEILTAGIYKDTSQQLRYAAVPSPAFTQKDSSNHKTYICLRFDAPYRIDRLTLRFADLPFYRRPVMLYDGGNTAGEGIADNHRLLTIATSLHSDTALIVIDNEDNPPLHLLEIMAAQQSQYLLAYLSPTGGATSLYFGDASLSAPRYDLRYLGDSLDLRALPLLMPGTVETAPTAGLQAQPAAKPLIGTAGMWAIIIVVLAGLIAATLVMMRRIEPRG